MVNFKPPFSPVFSEAGLFVPEQREEGRCQAVCQKSCGDEPGGPESIPSFCLY